jgi:GT2 family glycosyltransferase
MPESMRNLKTAIVIATKARPQILAATLQSIRRQTLKAALTYVSGCSPEDIPTDMGNIEGLVVLTGSVGGSLQRNVAIRHAPAQIQYFAFFDDDMEIHPSYLQNAVSFLEHNPDVVAISGRLLADGNITREAAGALVEKDTTWRSDPWLRDRGAHHILYACNAVIRAEPLRQTLFDENLPLYSYGEDYELSLRLKTYGRIGRLSNAVGVHLQTRAARVSGKRYGYAMVANNWYFLKKGVCHLTAPWSYIRFLLVIVLKRLCLNLKDALSGKWQRDPWGQIQGNLLAVLDVVAGRSSPQRILDL